MTVSVLQDEAIEDFSALTSFLLEDLFKFESWKICTWIS
jgi:hypothetical protein